LSAATCPALRKLTVTSARVLIVDDHPLVREGLATRINSRLGLEICGEAADVDEALLLLDRDNPDLVIVDLTLRSGHGLEVIKKAAKRQPATKFLVVSAHDESLYARRALEEGAPGYVNKREAQNNIIAAVSTVLRGERYLSEAMTRQLVGTAIGKHRTRAGGIESLSDRELEIFDLIGRGKSTKAIASDLHLSIHTIETHRENIRAKLGLRNGAELTRSAVQWALESGNGS